METELESKEGSRNEMDMTKMDMARNGKLERHGDENERNGKIWQWKEIGMERNGHRKKWKQKEAETDRHGNETKWKEIKPNEI